jgi:O-antigen/teichoic acid export membrane protein
MTMSVAVLTTALGMLGSGGFAAIECNRHGLYVLRITASLVSARRMVGFGSLMAINGLAAIFVYQIQRYFIASVLGPAAVGVYHLASVGPSKAHAGVNALTELLYPLASAGASLCELRKTYKVMVAASALFAVLAVSPFVVAPRAILTMWIGPNTASEVAPLLPWFVVGYFFIAMSPAPYHLLNGLGRVSLNTGFFCLAGALNLLFVLTLCRQAATVRAFAVSFCLANLVTSVLYHLYLEVVVWPKLHRAALDAEKQIILNCR